MDIATEAEILLREAGYHTRALAGGVVPAVCAENQALLAFLHVFSSAENLLNDWESAQQAVLVRHAAALRGAAGKAWNVYSIFLTAEVATSRTRAIERIEEDFSLARKIAKEGVQTTTDLGRALLPLLRLKAQPLLDQHDYRDRLQARLKDVAPKAVTAFLGAISPEEIARLLEDEK